MKQMLLLIGSFLTATALFIPTEAMAQTAQPTQTESADSRAVFRGGDRDLFDYVARNVEVSEELKNQGLTGTVYASFVVTVEGGIRDISIKKGFHPELDKEVLRVLKTLPPHWTPAMRDGQKVEEEYTLPVRFAYGN